MNRPPAPAGSDQGGLPYALGAYTIWGFVPLFFKLLESVPPVEVLSQRIIWSLPLCFVIMLFRRQIGDYLDDLLALPRDPATVDQLRRRRLIHGSTASSDASLEAYHDRVRDIALAGVQWCVGRLVARHVATVQTEVERRCARVAAHVGATR